MNWWRTRSTRGRDGIICDGAVRSGKSSCMALSFALWGLTSFGSVSSFGMCGKTIVSLRRNVIAPLVRQLGELGCVVKEVRSKNMLEVTLGKSRSIIYLFGGKDEGSASLIQGITLSGVFLDEVALMPRSFVEQAIARCSVKGSKLWFNCNPDNPYHWFKKEWIDKA